MFDLVILVVLYNKSIKNITSFNNFRKVCLQGNYKLVVIDNSTKEEVISHNESETKNTDFIVYICNHTNIGLSKAYNKGYGSIDAKWYMLADDDTLFSLNYLNNIITRIQYVSTDYLLGGIIRSQNGFFSPLKQRKLLGRNNEFITTPGEYNNIYAVNSGLVISKATIVKLEGFDERLFLDMVDYNIMETLIRKNLNHFIIVDGDVQQSFSGNTVGSLKSSLLRFKIFKKDIKMFCKINGLGQSVAIIYICKRGLNIFKNWILTCCVR